MSYKNEQIQSLIEHNDELENYFKNTIIPQLLIDADLILQKCTPPAMKQFNLRSYDIGKSIRDMEENLRFPAIIENILHVIDNNEILEKEIQTTDFRWFQMNIIPFVSYSNKINGVIITFVEITRRIKDLKTLEKLIADHEILIDTISHDIKNPLTSLMLAIDSFKNVCPEDSPVFQSLLKIVDNSVKKMKTIIFDLTDSRKQEHKYKEDEELINFEHILEDVRLAITDNIIESGAIIKTEIGVSEINFSRKKLRSLLFNLVNNAIKFRSADRKPEIFIETTRENNFIVITVKDNGIGIDTTRHEDIFSKYFRVEDRIEGSGVGLFLVNEIVRNSGGRILVESRLGNGTEFKIYLKENK
jgi:two-component system, OmpR family, phosphate regulon sensor histidine kinase PhoR